MHAHYLKTTLPLSTLKSHMEGLSELFTHYHKKPQFELSKDDCDDDEVKLCLDDHEFGGRILEEAMCYWYGVINVYECL